MTKTLGIWDPSIPPESNHYNWTGEPVVVPRSRNPNEGALTVVDLFCGCGGFAEGFRQAGFEAVLSVDIHKPSVDTFRFNHPTASVIMGDMRKVSDSQVESVVGSSHVDVISAGVPCQGFSLNNRKRWDQDERNFLFREFIRVVDLFQPSVVVLENVSGLRMAANGAFKHAITEAIHESGYDVQSEILNALEFGVPQRRQRVFFVGVRQGLEWFWPDPTHGAGLLQPVSVWSAIGDLPAIMAGEESSTYIEPPSTDYQRYMRQSASTLLNHCAPNHPAEVIDKIAKTLPGQPMYPRFKQRIRLHPDLPSPTQVSGGIRPQFQFGHPTLARGLTVRERCRIQSFPDQYYISGGTVQGRVQTGNAVPPLLARALAEQIRSVIRGEPRQGASVSKAPRQVELI